MEYRHYITLFIFPILFGAVKQTNAQIIWQKTLGGNNYEEMYTIQATRDKGYISAGFSLSSNGDMPGNYGGADIILIKQDSLGNIEWMKNYGGSDHDTPYSVIEIQGGGGFLVVGGTYSNDLDVDGNHGDKDGWVFRIDPAGNLLWQKCYGGTKEDDLTGVVAGSNGGYLISGFSYSSNGDLSVNEGLEDFWIIHIDTSGTLLWSKTYGGSSFDRPWTIVSTDDGGCLVAGDTNSSNGDVTGSNGGLDAWVLKINWEGKKVWQKCFGGVFWDRVDKMVKVENNEYVLAGFAMSNTGIFSGNHGKEDCWVFKINDEGDLLWQKLLGGTMPDRAFAITAKEDGGFWLASIARSSDGDVSLNKGSTDVWISKLSSAGELEWERALGGSGLDWVTSVTLSHDDKCVFAGYTWSNNGDVPGPLQGESDFWIVKVGENFPTSTQTPTPVALDLFPNPAQHYLSLSLPQDERAVRIIITDAQGREWLMPTNNAQQRLDISRLPAGAYWLTATTLSGQRYVGRFVKE